MRPQQVNLDDLVLRHARLDIAPLNLNQTITQALAHLRANPPKGRVVYFYVVDDDQRLQGVVPTRLLLLSNPEAKISEIMNTKVVTIPYTATVMHACEVFTLHKFLGLPVVDENRRLLGVLDIELYTDEIADLASRTGYDDLFQLVGVRASEARNGTSLTAFRLRFPWLLCNVFGGISAAFLTGNYQDVLDRRVVLALFIPVVLGLAESVGIQSVSLVLQTLHGRKPDLSTLVRSVSRESLTGLMLGLGCGALVGIVAWLWKGQAPVAIGLFATISLSVSAAAIIGMAIPIVMGLLKRDPGVAAGPIALVAADLTALFLYFEIARTFLG